MIVIFDYGVGNIGSIASMLKKIGAQVLVSNKPNDLEKCSKIILPGVGSYDKAMSELHKQNLIPVLNNEVLINKKKILGICLGAQILGVASEEGGCCGLGWIDMVVKRLSSLDLPVPHMGWNVVKPTKQSCLFGASPDIEYRFYFAHSYYMFCNNQDNVIAACFYERDFVCAVQQDNIFGVQFHPEKSHSFGFDLLKRFINA